MERLQRWFGGGEHKSSAPKTMQGNSTEVGKVDSIDAATSYVKPTLPATTQASSSAASQTQQPAVPSDVSVTETRVGQMMQQGRAMILRVVPLAEGDCLSCKLIGSGVMFGAAVFVLFSYPKVKTRYTGFKRMLFALQVGSLSSCLTLLGAARLFDLSVFSPPDAEGNRKSLGQLLDEDMDSLQKLFSRIYTTDSASDAKKDS